MSKFTKGKWKYLEALHEVTAYPETLGNNIYDCPVYADSGCGQDITGELRGSNEEEIHANGRLIAAAPEMYMLLNKAHDMLYRLIIGELTAIEFRDLTKLIRESAELIARIDGDEAEHE